MNTFLLLAIGIQGAFVLLDLVEWHRRRDSAAAPPEGRGAWLFLLALIGLYFALQFGGYSLVPRTGDLLLSTRTGIARLFHLPLTDAPMNPGRSYVLRGWVRSGSGEGRQTWSEG